ncbi:MAG TPA: RNA polymerase sigma factor [Vicinamibacterales bacterium]|nr:RNA polymerase sigma factor [Vicinamibacterales bacterium]HPW21855.1 RNA polymerase sigma factor [Vicinamibacterales bacterium]
MASQGSLAIVDLEGTVVALAPRVLRYATARLGDRALAEDVAQESLAALVRACRNGGAPASPDAFVFAIARRRAARASWRQRLWLPLESAAGNRSHAPTPEARALARDEAERVRAAIARLSSRDREAILLVAAAGLSMADAASALRISVPAVKRRVSRARARLAARVAARTLASAPGSRHSRMALATAAAILVLAAALTVRQSAELPAPPAVPDAISGTLSDGLLVVRMPDGSTSITGGPARQSRPPEGHGLLLVEGEAR